MPLPVLQKVLGHSSIRTTALYWKGTNDPKEKVISDKWLNGKIPKEPVKPIENKPRELINVLITKNHWEINLFIPKLTRNSELEKENKLFLSKVYFLPNRYQRTKEQREGLRQLDETIH